MIVEPHADAPLILLIEDEADLASLIGMALRVGGYRVETAASGPEGLMKASQCAPDLIILDWMLPEMSGIDVCQRIRQASAVPILMLTSKSAIADRVAGLDAGASDYLVKPVAVEELLARVRAHLRVWQAPDRQHYQFADLQVARESRRVSLGSRAISLSPREFDLLVYFLQHPERALSRKAILAAVWQAEHGVENNLLDVYVRYLRQKLEAGGEPRLIHTIRGVGFMLSLTPPA